jgi:predicted kinase
VDEEMLARHGQIGVDHRVQDHIELLGPVVDWARERTVELLCSGTSVVFDHGLGTREQRDDFKHPADDHGARHCHHRRLGDRESRQGTVIAPAPGVES